MTLEQRASALMEGDGPPMRHEVLAALRAVRDEERARCARVAREEKRRHRHLSDGKIAAEHIARRIESGEEGG